MDDNLVRMNRGRVTIALFATAVLATTVACATSEAVDDFTSDSDFIQASDEDAGPATAKVPPPSSGESSSGSSAQSDGGASSSGGSSSSSSSSGGGGSSSGGGGSCAATNTCASPALLTEMRGDQGNDSQTTTGTGSKWLRVRVVEDTTGAFGKEMQLTATLTSPAGSNYDLYFHVGSGENDLPSCSVATQSLATAASPESTTLKWGESGSFANGVKDHRWITIEVRHISGPCTSPWKLDLRGPN